MTPDTPPRQTDESRARGAAFGWMSSLLFFLGACVYCYGVVHFARLHVATEALISVAFVALAAPWFRLEGDWISRVRLIVVESLFNAIALLAKVFFLLGISTDSPLIDNLFAVFFVLQVLGFVVAQIRKRKFSLMPANAAMACGLTMWFLSGEGVHLTADGALQFWGGDAPIYLRWMYVFWVLGVLMVEYASLLPKATVLLTHLASVTVAFTSGEFFHARILTASHLFIINFVVLFERPEWGGERFVSMPWLSKLSPRLVAWVVNVSCVGTLAAWSVLSGLGLVSSASLDGIIHRNDLAEIRPGSSEYERTVQVRYLGVSGVSIRAGKDHIITAPFYSNPGLGRVILGSLAPRRELVLELAPPLDDVQAVLVGHSHYDHLMDVPVLAQERLPAGCVIYGSRTTAHILAAAGIEQKVEVMNDDAGDHLRPGAWRQASARMRIMALRSGHAPHFAGIRAYDGVYDQDLEALPTTAGGWLLGLPLAYLIDVLDAESKRPLFRIYYQDAAAEPPAGLPPPLGDGKSVDLAILCVAAFGQVDHHPEGIVTATRPRFVLATHWEDFFRPQTEALAAVPGTDPEEFLRRLEDVLPRGSEYWMPAPGTLFHFPVEDRTTTNPSNSE